MTDDTQPEAFDLADWLEAVGGGPSAKRCAALLREQHARIAELESELEAVGAGGVQALSAAPEAIAKLRHLYQNMVNGAVRDTASAKRIAEGLLAPAIEALERATPPAEQQAQPDECFPGEPKVAVPQGLIGAACCVIRNKSGGGKVLEQLRRYSVGDRSQPLAPQPAPAPLSEMPYEKRKAIQEGEQIGASDAWFKARHEMLDTVDRRNVFRAGFDRGWSAALAAQGGKV